jgi:hypothetical protein
VGDYEHIRREVARRVLTLCGIAGNAAMHVESGDMDDVYESLRELEEELPSVLALWDQADNRSRYGEEE